MSRRNRRWKKYSYVEPWYVPGFIGTLRGFVRTVLPALIVFGAVVWMIVLVLRSMSHPF
jgi:hypothetical protein